MMIKPEELRKLTHEAVHKQATKEHADTMAAANESKNYIERWYQSYLDAMPTLLRNAAIGGQNSVIVFNWILDSDRYGRDQENAAIGARLMAALIADEHTVEYVDHVETIDQEKENHRSIVVSW